MVNENIEKLVEHYLNLKLNGMDFSAIRNELKQEGVDGSDIKTIINSIDDKILHGVKSGKANSVSNLTKFVGILLLVGGLIVTIGTYIGWIDLKGHILFAYGPILGGLTILVSSSKKRSKKFNKTKRIRK